MRALHSLAADPCVSVQVTPSGLVMTTVVSVTAQIATATKFCCPASPPHVTELHSLFAAEFLSVQVTPSGLVITRLPVPVELTATKSLLPQVTEVQSFSTGVDRDVQVTPSGLVITRLPVPD